MPQSPDYEAGFNILEPWVAQLVTPEYIFAGVDIVNDL